MELDARKLRVLAAIVETYIGTGEPVGSKWVAQQLDGEVSPATIRNDMAALFEMGLIEQPHTSAGRIPSHLGFRVYIDRLMRYKPLSSQEKAEINALFNVRNPDPDRLLEDAAKALAYQTNCVTISTTFIPHGVTVKHIDLIRVSSQTVVILLVASNGIIRNKVCRVDFNVTDELISFFTSFANGRLAGMSLSEISAGYINAAAISLGEYSRIFNPLLTSIYELCKEVSDGQFFQSGAEKLLDYSDLRQMAHEIFRLLGNRSEVVEMVSPGDGSALQIKVGRENPNQELSELSLIVSRYKIGSENAGAIGIIGPVRMDYARLVPHLQYFAETLGGLLSDTLDEHGQA